MGKRIWSSVAIPPGEMLAEELEVREMTQSELARKMGRPVQVINEIIRAKKAITAATAWQLEAALGIEAHFWMGLEVNYQLNKVRLANLAKAGKVKKKAAGKGVPDSARVLTAAPSRG